jgi:hypothetical protein
MGAIVKTRLVFLIFVVAVLQGCSATDDLKRRYADRWGPDTTLVSDDVAATLGRQHSVMAGVVTLAYADSVLPGQPGILMTPANWYSVAQFGFNYVDEKCDLYMHDLFILNREHDRNDTIFKTVSSVSNAVISGTLAATNAKIPLLVVAQSFGLINDAAAKSYLFEQVPGLIADKVKQARLVYRDVVDKNKQAVIDEMSAYRAIKDYLSLCMPQTIEGNFLTTYIAANPIPVPASSPGATAPKTQASLSSTVTGGGKVIPKVGATAPNTGGSSPTLNFMVKPL